MQLRSKLATKESSLTKQRLRHHHHEWLVESLPKPPQFRQTVEFFRFAHFSVGSAWRPNCAWPILSETAMICLSLLRTASSRDSYGKNAPNGGRTSRRPSPVAILGGVSTMALLLLRRTKWLTCLFNKLAPETNQRRLGYRHSTDDIRHIRGRLWRRVSPLL